MRRLEYTTDKHKMRKHKKPLGIFYKIGRINWEHQSQFHKHRPINLSHISYHIIESKV